MSEELNMNSLIKSEETLPALPEEPKSGSLTKTKSYIRNIIVEQDPKLLEIWDEIDGEMDLNEVVMFNFQQAQVHLQQEQVRYYTLNAKVDAALEKITDIIGKMGTVGTDEAEIQVKAHEVCQKQLEKSRTYILKLQSSSTSMAKEHRQCQMQQKFIIHIIQVQKLLMGIRASIDANVHDLNALNAIRADMKELNRDLFGVRG